MSRRTTRIRLLAGVVSLLAILFFGVNPPATAAGKIGLYGIRMVPDGDDAEEFSDANWGIGLHVVVPAPQLANILAGTAGLEYINFMSSTTEFRDRITGLRTEQQTRQDYFRLYLGPQIGGHGHGFVRPHAGLNLAMVWYGIGTDVVIPDDHDRENEIRQSLGYERHVVFGYDITLGVDLYFSDKVVFDGGVRYLKSFGLPQQLGDGSKQVHPQYFQIYFGVGISFAQNK